MYLPVKLTETSNRATLQKMKKTKMPKDPNLHAIRVIELATGEKLTKPKKKTKKKKAKK